jgi:hypothetical protein
VVSAEGIAKQLFVTIKDLHSGHGTDEVAESEGEKKLRFGELAPKYEKDTPQARLRV